MYKFLQTHGKKIMAVSSAFLMIAFMLPSAYKYAGAGRNQVIGRVGNEKLSATDLYQAKRSWDVLNNMPWGKDPSGRQAHRLGQDAFAQITQHPLMFLLLQKEARQMGVTVSNDQLQSELVNTPGFETADDDK